LRRARNEYMPTRTAVGMAPNAVNHLRSSLADRADGSRLFLGASACGLAARRPAGSAHRAPVLLPALQGRLKVASGGAQRNPWKGTPPYLPSTPTGWTNARPQALAAPPALLSQTRSSPEEFASICEICGPSRLQLAFRQSNPCPTAQSVPNPAPTTRYSLLATRNSLFPPTSRTGRQSRPLCPRPSNPVLYFDVGT
jgi:hypothetical protein